VGRGGKGVGFVLRPAGFDIDEELADNRLHTAFVDDEAEAKGIGVIEFEGPRGDDAAVNRIVLELDQLERLLPSHLIKRLELLLDRGRESRKTDNTGVGLELLGWHVFRLDKVLDRCLGAGHPGGEAELGRVDRISNRAGSFEALQWFTNDPYKTQTPVFRAQAESMH
jgi:hypothetical protein